MCLLLLMSHFALVLDVRYSHRLVCLDRRSLVGGAIFLVGCRTIWAYVSAGRHIGLEGCRAGLMVVLPGLVPT